MKKLLTVLLTLCLLAALLPMTASAELLPEGASVARAVNDEGIVLLKNENGALPLKEGAHVALLGEAQADHFNESVNTLTPQRGYIPFGSGSAWSINKEKHVFPLDALIDSGKVTVNAALADGYRADPDYVPDDAALSAAASAADTAIVFLSRWGGECIDFTEWSLTAKEKTLLSRARASFKTVVVVLNTGGAIDTRWADEAETRADALLFAGYGGLQGGLGIADVLTGAVNPSGKLTSTWCADVSDYPTDKAFRSGKIQEYTEDIFLGYRWFETFDQAGAKVRYPFGFGLSYTTFELSSTPAKVTDDTVSVDVTVKNTGAVAGKETVQLYFRAPDGKLGKAARALAAFEKTGLLSPGQAQTLTLSFPVSDMASYDDTGKTGHKSATVLEAGDYQFLVGSSVRSLTECGSMNLKELKVVEQLTEKCPTNLSERLLADGTTEKLEKPATPAPTKAPEKKEDKGEIVIEAEDYEDVGGSGDDAPNEEYMPGGAMYLYPDTGEWDEWEGGDLGNTWRAGAYAIYKVKLAAKDTFRVSFRASTRQDVTAVITLWTSQDGEHFTEALKSVRIPDTFTLNEVATNLYHNYIDVGATKDLTLPAGETYFKVTFEGYPNLDSFTLTSKSGKSQATPEPTATPLPTPPEPADRDRYDRLADVLNGSITMKDLTAQMKNAELASFFVSYDGNTAGASPEVGAKYGLTNFRMSDSSQGVGGGSTSYPCETLLAQTWNKRLAEAYALSLGQEAYSSGIDMVLTPAMNLHRHPLSGRNFEYYSEDPLLTGTFGTIVVKGLQSVGVSACPKHFVCNEIEKDKLQSDSRVSERALRELYLRPFRMAITEGKAWGIMSSYNILNGTPVSENGDLLTGILRGEWGFEGFVTGDWNNDKNPIAEINAGNNVREPVTNCDINKILKAIGEGKISRETLETGAAQVMFTISRSQRFIKTNVICGGKHTFENGFCTKCFAREDIGGALAKKRITELLAANSAPVSESTDPEATNAPGEATAQPDGPTETKGKFPWVIVLIAVVLIAAAAGVIVAVKKKKK